MIRLILFLALIHHHPCKGLLCGGQVAQNQEIDRLGLVRVVDDNQLYQLIRTGELVRLTENEKLRLEPQVIPWVRPWTVAFVMDMADRFYSDFHGVHLIVDSAIRTVEQQQKLRRTNRFAAPEVGPEASSHLAGTTVDLAKKKYTRKQRRWIEKYLSLMVERNLAIVAREPWCYHIFVRPEYLNDN